MPVGTSLAPYRFSLFPGSARKPLSALGQMNGEVKRTLTVATRFRIGVITLYPLATPAGVLHTYRHIGSLRT